MPQRNYKFKDKESALQAWTLLLFANWELPDGGDVFPIRLGLP